MSFRKVGGLQYSATQNIVKSRYNTSDNLYVTQNVGQPNTYINFESDISGNIIIYGDLDVSGNLHVLGDIDCSGNETIAKNLYVLGDIDCSGNVDINGYLHVQQDIDCSGNLYTDKDAYINSVRVGRGKGSILTNTVVGNQALNSNSNIIGIQNTAVGYLSLRANTIGPNNTAIGANTLYNNIDGSLNVAVGSGALYNTNKNGNIGIGINTLFFNSTGSNNLAIGTESGTNYNILGPTNCTNCAFIGTYSGNTTISGAFSNSTAIGFQSQITANSQITLGTTSEKVFIPKNLQIGGTYSTSSTNTLDVTGNGNFTGNVYVGPDGTSTSALFFGSPVSGDASYEFAQIKNRLYGGTENTELILFKGNDGATTSGPDRIRLRAGAIAFDTYTSVSTDPNTENIRMFINDTGNVGINTTNPGTVYKLNVNGDVNASTYNAGSDYRIKENVKIMDESFIIDSLKPVTYFNKKTEKQDIGLIAHELQEIYPFLVTGEKDGESMQSVNYIGLIGLLIKEIQELKKEVKILKSNLLFSNNKEK
jgi:predicted acyltransferase (DUF342 family)